MRCKVLFKTLFLKTRYLRHLGLNLTQFNACELSATVRRPTVNYLTSYGDAGSFPVPNDTYLVRLAELEQVQAIGIPLIDYIPQVGAFHGVRISVGRHLNYRLPQLLIRSWTDNTSWQLPVSPHKHAQQKIYRARQTSARHFVPVSANRYELLNFGLGIHCAAAEKPKFHSSEWLMQIT